MLNIFYLFLLFLQLNFSTHTDRLGSPRFAERKAASSTLKKWFPLSIPACYAALNKTESPEVRERCLSLLTPLNAVAESWQDDNLIWTIVFDRRELDGLPLFDVRGYEHIVWDGETQDAMVRFVKRMRRVGLLTRTQFYCLGEGPCNLLPFPTCYEAYTHGMLTGIDSVRFVFRGLSDPVWEDRETPAYVYRMAWAIKKQNRGE